jgi:hypothetical protein
MNKITITFFALFLSLGLHAQEEEEVKPVKNVFQGTRFINLQSANVVGKNELQMFIQHRFGDISEGFYKFFGLDENTNRFGFEYGVSKNFTVGIGRSTFYKTFDSFLKYRLLTQTVSIPLTVTATVAGSFPTIKNVIPDANSDFSEKASGNVQLHIAKSWENVGFQLSPGYIGTGYIPEKGKSISFITMAAGGSVKLSKKVSVNAEYLYRFEDEIVSTNPLSASIEIKTGGHLFQILISNTRQMYDQAIITNPDGGDWTTGNLFLGFNLIRTFNFKQY